MNWYASIALLIGFLGVCALYAILNAANGVHQVLIGIYNLLHSGVLQGKPGEPGKDAVQPLPLPPRTIYVGFSPNMASGIVTALHGLNQTAQALYEFVKSGELRGLPGKDGENAEPVTAPEPQVIYVGVSPEVAAGLDESKPRVEIRRKGAHWIHTRLDSLDYLSALKSDEFTVIMPDGTVKEGKSGA